MPGLAAVVTEVLVGGCIRGWGELVWVRVWGYLLILTEINQTVQSGGDDVFPFLVGGYLCGFLG
jgi:hypothetical protein